LYSSTQKLEGGRGRAVHSSEALVTNRASLRCMDALGRLISVPSNQYTLNFISLGQLNVLFGDYVFKLQIIF